VTLLKARLVLVALLALGDSGHDEAVTALSALVGKATNSA
jgi:hypothetical protein